MADNVKVLKIDTGAAQTSVKDLRNELKELKSTMLSTEKGTEEYNKALKQAAEIQHTLKEQMEEVNASAMDFGQIASNCTKAVGGLVGGFQAATAVMNLFGAENEDVIKTLKTMQQLMALTQALPAIDNGVKAFKRLALAIQASSTALKGLSTAAIATGLGAITAALGLLIANWDKVSDAMRKWGIINEDTTKKVEEHRKKIEDLRKEVADLEADYANYLREKKIEKLNDTAKKSYEDLTDRIEELSKQQKIALANAYEAWEKEGEKAGNIYKEQSNNLLTQIELLRKEQQAILDNADSYKKLTKEEEAFLAKQKEINIALWDSTQKLQPKSLQDELNQKFRDNPLTIPAKLEIDESEDEDTEFLAKADELRKKITNTVEGLRNAFKTPEEQYAEEQRALEIWYNTQLTLYQDNENKKLEIQEEYNRLSGRLADEHKQLMQQKAVQEAQIWMSALGNLGSVFASIADMIDTSTEEGEEKYKALMYTSTVISMLAGIGGAIASAFNPANSFLTIFGQIAMAATTSASVLASGIAQLMQIKNANKNTNLSGGYATPSTGAITQMIAPVQYTQDVQGANIEGAIRDSKVYVTETDITKTQNKVRVSETEARF